MLRTGAGAERRFAVTMLRELWGACCAGGCTSQDKTGTSTKACLDLNEEEQEISLIREKEKKTHSIRLVFVLVEKQDMCFGIHPKCLFNERSGR